MNRQTEIDAATIGGFMRLNRILFGECSEEAIRDLRTRTAVFDEEVVDPEDKTEAWVSDVGE
jgi:hypothetical protein